MQSNSIRPAMGIADSGCFAGGFFQEFVDEVLVGLGLFGGHEAELAEKFWGEADGDELFGMTRGGAADSTSAAEFGGGRFGRGETAERAAEQDGRIEKPLSDYRER
ncbi:MAG: hypothetical protein ACRD51_17470 [Candidatus Acidiferrum sp.]